MNLKIKAHYDKKARFKGDCWFIPLQPGWPLISHQLSYIYSVIFPKLQVTILSHLLGFVRLNALREMVECTERA